MTVLDLQGMQIQPTEGLEADVPASPMSPILCGGAESNLSMLLCYADPGCDV